jgi:hypothetical protein
VSLLGRLKNWRAAKKADRRAIARAASEARRADDEPTKSTTDTVDDVAGTFPPEG